MVNAGKNDAYTWNNIGKDLELEAKNRAKLNQYLTKSMFVY
jgi:hypothetical protein